MADMRDLQAAIAAGCRAIEQVMAKSGQTVSTLAQEVQQTRNHWSRNEVILKVELAIQLHDVSTQRLSAGALNPPQSITDVPDRGHLAGTRALLQKFQQAIQNATDLAEGRPTQTGIEQVTEAARRLRPDDPVPKMLIAVATLCKAKTELEEKVAELQRVKGPDEQLRERLQLKMRAHYVEQRDVLIDFCKHVVLQAWQFRDNAPEGKPADGTAEKVVDAFLETVGED